MDQLVRLAGVGDHDDDVARRDHSEVPVDCLGRVEEQRRSTGGRHGRGELPTDDAGLAHAGPYDTPLAAREHLHRLHEGVVEAISQPQDCFGFRGQNLSCQFQRHPASLGQ